MVAGRPPAALTQLAQVHSYTTAFWWAAGMFAAGAILAALLFRPGPPAVSAAAEPTAAQAKDSALS